MGSAIRACVVKTAAPRVFVVRIPSQQNSGLHAYRAICLNGLVRSDSVSDCSLHPGQLHSWGSWAPGFGRGIRKAHLVEASVRATCVFPSPVGSSCSSPAGRCGLSLPGALGEGFLQVISRKACDLGHKPGSYDRGPSRGPSGSWCSL